MNRIVVGAFTALLFVAAGLFWWQGRAEMQSAAPPPIISGKRRFTRRRFTKSLASSVTELQ